MEDESKHYQRRLPVSKEAVADYKARMKEINARPVKKIAEAKARKKRKVKKNSVSTVAKIPVDSCHDVPRQSQIPVSSRHNSS